MAQGQDVEDFVTRLLGQYPRSRLLDIYKSSFQDYMGAEHLVGDTASARAYLEQELDMTRDEALLPWLAEPCGVGGNYVRVSLAAVHAGLIDADMLLDAFIRSANVQRPSLEQWAQRWREMVGRIDAMGLDLPRYQEDKSFIESVLEQGHYAISHSPEFREAYAPHYRIVSRDIFDKELRHRLVIR